jgi:dihydroxy-acid dehydratase
MSEKSGEMRSQRWFGTQDVAGLIHRAYLSSEGISRSAFAGRPVIGICNTWSELVNCNLHFRTLAQAVKRGVLQAGGLPLEFPTISLGEAFMKPTTMLYRNLMAMDVEETIRANPLDAVVLLGGCDKTIPATLMGAASVDLPTIMVTGGPTEPAVYCGRQLGAGTDLWKYTDDFRAGRMSAAEYEDLEAALVPSVGHCPEMGTASTMSAIVEALGMSLPGSAFIPAVDARRYSIAEATGKQAVELAKHGLRPSQVMTAKSFDNAIAVLMALGGSTNAVIHLLALAGRLGINLALERFDEISTQVPLIVNVRPSGEHLVEQLFHAGGLPAVMSRLDGTLNLDCLTVTGRALGDNITGAKVADDAVISSRENPWQGSGSIVVLKGNLAPRGALIKRSAASPNLLQHRGKAVVFDDIDDLAARVDDVEIDEETVMVLRNSGPKGGPGMPEWGQLPVPTRLLRKGVRDIVRISDARMSGTAFGTVVLHICPESADGGPLGVVKDGDAIVLDVDARRLDLDIGGAELKRRMNGFHLPARKYSRGYGALYLDHVMQADKGCDFDFLQRIAGEPFEREPLGLVGGPIMGW